jgi:hypothetical protein
LLQPKPKQEMWQTLASTTHTKHEIHLQIEQQHTRCKKQFIDQFMRT